MKRRSLKWFAGAIIIFTYAMVLLSTTIEGNDRRRTAIANVDIMAKSAKDVDIRLKETLEALAGTYATKSDVLNVLATLQYDFDYKKGVVTNRGVVTYQLDINSLPYSFLVKYRYFLESTLIAHEELTPVSEYRLLAVDPHDDVVKEDVREMLGVTDENYIYYKEVLSFENGDELLLVALINKPWLYVLARPSSVSEYLILIVTVTLAFGLLYSILLNFASYINRSRQLGLIAHTDRLTGVGNQRALDTHDWHEHDTLIMLDIKPHERANSKLGYSTRDIMLNSFAEAIKLSTRGHDKVIRLSNHEFVIIVPGATSQAVGSVVKRIRMYSKVSFEYGFAIYDLKKSRSALLQEAEAMLNDDKKETP